MLLFSLYIYLPLRLLGALTAKSLAGYLSAEQAPVLHRHPLKQRSHRYVEIGRNPREASTRVLPEYPMTLPYAS